MLDDVSPVGIRVNTIILAFTLLAGIVVFLRLFTRLVLTKGAGCEDVCIATAMVLSITLAVVTSEQVMHGLGKHIDTISAGDVPIVLKIFWASRWIYNLTLTTIKVAILVQYIRIFPTRQFRCACYAVLCIVITCGAWGIFGNVFLCYPINFFWNRSEEGGHCLNGYAVWYTTACLNIGQDIIILFLPIQVVRSLQITKSQKKGLITMFALGASAIVVSIVRLYSLDHIANSTDQTFDNSDQATLSGVEINVGIICACLPAMRPLFAVMMPKYFSSTTAYSTVPAYDIERPKEFRSASVSTRVDTPTQSIRPTYLRTGSTPSQLSLDMRTRNFGQDSPYNQSRNGSFSHTRNDSFSPPRSGSFSQIRNGSFSSPRNDSIAHSRTGSNLSVTIPRSGTTAGPFQGKPMNPLRMSPVTSFAPPIPLRLGRLSEDDTITVAPGAYSRRPSDASINLTRLPPTRRRPRTPVNVKPLPLTPFPVGSGHWPLTLPLTLPTEPVPKLAETRTTEDA